MVSQKHNVDNDLESTSEDLDLASQMNIPSEVDFIQLVKDGNLVAVQITLEKNKAIVDKQNENGETALHWASITGRVCIVKHLLTLGANTSLCDNLYNAMPLHWAVWGGSTRSISTLIKYGAPINAKDLYGFTPLMLSSTLSNIYAAMILTSNGADVNLQDNSGKTALAWAVIKGNYEITKELLKSGANPDMFDYECKTPLLYALEAQSNSNIVTSLVEFNASKSCFSKFPSSITKRYIKDIRSNSYYKSKPKKILVYLLHLLYLIHIFLAVLLPLLFIKFSYGIFISVFLPVILSFDVIFLPKLPGPLINTLAPCIVLFTLFAALIATSIMLFDSSPYKILSYITFALNIVAILSYFLARNINSSIIPKSNPKDKKEIISFRSDYGVLDNKSFCYTCYVDRPYLSSHCSKCDQCVLKFSHHCIWTDSCIGLHNYKYFFILISSIFVAVVLLISTTILILKTVRHLPVSLFKVSLASYLRNPLYVYLIVLNLLSFIHIIWLPLLIAFHIYLLFNGLTSYAFIVNRISKRKIPQSNSIPTHLTNNPNFAPNVSQCNSP